MAAKVNEMADTYTLTYKNFRSLEDVTLEVAPLTVVYGPNGSGKSSLIYGLLTLRNFLTNPNQYVSGFFSYPYLALGALQEVAFRHALSRKVSVSIDIADQQSLSTKFTLSFDQAGGTVDLAFDQASIANDNRVATWPASLGMAIGFPFQGNQQVDGEFSVLGPSSQSVSEGSYGLHSLSGTLFFNGTQLYSRWNADVTGYTDFAEQIFWRAILPMETAKQTGFVPLRRGFSSPAYGMSAVSPLLSRDEEVASSLASPADRFAYHEISGFVERIAGRRIQPQAQFGTSSFTIDSIPVGKGVPVSIVNEGFGINQLVYMLTICLYSGYKIVAIEEPEIHLHPSMVRELAIALAEIAVEKERRLIVSTHSETFVIALLSQIAAGKIKTDDVSFVLAENPNGSTVLTQQKANRSGQIEGGLRAFMASEAKDLVDFLGLSSE